MSGRWCERRRKQDEHRLHLSRRGKALPPARPAYAKGMLSFREQAERLKARGMEGDVAAIERRLATTNYYRLSGYFYFFRTHQGPNRHVSEQFRPGTTFDKIWELYVFDAKLRALVSWAMEKIEVALRTQISYHHGHTFGPFAYALDSGALQLGTKRAENGRIVDRRDDFLAEVQKSINRSREQFMDHFYDAYSDEYPPIFVVSETLTLGCVKHIYDGSPEDVQRAIANQFRLPPSVLGSWLLTFNTARNVCAHHGRFWNRSLGTRPSVPRDKIFHTPVEIFVQPTKSSDGTWVQPPTTFAILSMCNYLLHEIEPGSGWAKEVKKLLDAHPHVKKRSMGFPLNWTRSPVWRDVDEGAAQAFRANG